MDGIENKGRLFSLGTGALFALVIVSGYSLLKLMGSVAASAFPFVAGIGLFVGLMAIFLTLVATFKKMRRSSRKQLAIWDCYTSLAVIAVLGYFAAACVATFQPGGNPSALWTHGIASAALFALLFSGGKWAGTLFNEGGSTR